MICDQPQGFHCLDSISDFEDKEDLAIITFMGAKSPLTSLKMSKREAALTAKQLHFASMQRHSQETKVATKRAVQALVGTISESFPIVARTLGVPRLCAQRDGCIPSYFKYDPRDGAEAALFFAEGKPKPELSRLLLMLVRAFNGIV